MCAKTTKRKPATRSANPRYDEIVPEYLPDGSTLGYPKKDLEKDEIRAELHKTIDRLNEKGLEEAKLRLADLSSAAEFQVAASLSELSACNHPSELPSVAPKLWTARDKEREFSPAAFITEHYAKWVGNGLTNGLLQKLDVALYTAYRREVADQPEFMIPSLPLATRKKRLSDEEARERQLASKRKYYHRKKDL